MVGRAATILKEQSKSILNSCKTCASYLWLLVTVRPSKGTLKSTLRQEISLMF